jgi:4-amino-4-deoxy-L-arabinose transferase-like glycosyltransferase
MWMMVPVICFAVLLVTYAAICSEGGVLTRWRVSFLTAALTWGLGVTAITEGLSLFRLITFGWLLAAWIGAVLVSAAICATVSTREKLKALCRFPSIARFEFCCLTAVATIAALVALVALASPPNNADSMAYHMPRVMHWVQNQTVAHYPTNILRQLFQPPWSGYAIMQFQVLTGGDQWANLVQWFSMIGAVIGVSLIAKQLGADTRGQVLAAVIVATIPIGIVQASNTDNNYVTAFWLVCLVHYLLRFRFQPSWLITLGIGASLALALLTKATAYIYAFPFLLWLAFSAVRSWRWKFWQPLLLISAIVLIANLGHYTRNFELWGNPLGIDHQNPTGHWAEPSYAVNKVFGPRVILSNVIRNISLHLGTPNATVNGSIYEGVRFLHGLMRIDVSDPKTTFVEKFYQRHFTPDDMTAQSPIHFGLAIVGLALLLHSSKRNRADRVVYAISLVVAFLIFCSYLKWQPWNSRLHLPLFVLWSPLISVVIAGSPICILHWIVGSLIAVSLFFVVANETRPLIAIGPNRSVLNTSRVDDLFDQWPDIREAYLGAAEFLKAQKCFDIALDINDDNENEYQFWMLLQKTNQSIRIQHINVTNRSAVKSTVPPFLDFSPCAAIALGKSGDELKGASVNGLHTKGWSLEWVAVYIKPEPSRNFSTQSAPLR